MIKDSVTFCFVFFQDFLFSETVSFTRDGLLQKTPAHRYSEFRFRTYAPYAFRFFRHLFEIETELFLASLCSEPMVELANPGVSGSIFYVTRYNNSIGCKLKSFIQQIILYRKLHLNNLLCRVSLPILICECHASLIHINVTHDHLGVNFKAKKRLFLQQNC